MNTMFGGVAAVAAAAATAANIAAMMWMDTVGCPPDSSILLMTLTNKFPTGLGSLGVSSFSKNLLHPLLNVELLLVNVELTRNLPRTCLCHCETFESSAMTKKLARPTEPNRLRLWRSLSGQPNDN
jgi:hypothetical protein